MFEFFGMVADFFTSIFQVISLLISGAFNFLNLLLDVPGFLNLTIEYLPAFMSTFAFSTVLILIVKGIFGR